MKKWLPVILFVVAFVITYVGICYSPSFRIKLEAEPFEYFVASITHMVLFKAAVSAAAGLVVGVIPMIVNKLKKS